MATLTCDACRTTAGDYDSYEAWEDTARHLGWFVGEDVVLCVRCSGDAPAVDARYDAMAEMAWVFREGRALATERVPHSSPRWDEYLRRKGALIAYLATLER